MYIFNQKDMLDKAKRVIYLCGKTATPSQLVRDYIEVESKYTGRVLRFEPCKSSPFADNRIYYYNSEINAYATI